MSKVHQICPICAACNTKQKDGYYMCCACRHKWRDVESSSVFDRITESPEVLAPQFIVKHHKDGETQYYISFLNNTIYSKYEIALEATVAKLKEVEK